MSTKVRGRKKESYKIFDEIAGTYDLLNHLLSMGIDIYWRQKLLKKLPKKESIKAIDLATGTGDVAMVLVKDKTVQSVTGVDLSKGMIKIGNEKVAKKGLSDKIQLIEGDGQNIPAADESCDLVTISFGIRNFPDPKKSLNDIMRVLRPGGRLLIMEFSIPKNWLFRQIYFFYFRHLLPFVGNLISNHGDAYSYLNESVEDFAYGDEFAGWMKDAGFKEVNYTPLTFGIATIYQGDKH